MVPQKEASFQIALVEILRWALKPTVLFYHVPNGEHRDLRTAQKLKAMGVLPGCADLEFHWVELDAEKHKCRRVLYLELKADKGRLSPAQCAFALTVRLMNDAYCTARSVDEAIAILEARGLMRPDVKIGQLA